MKALVTGATGFVGSHLVRLLCQSGYAPRVLFRSSAKLAQFEDLELETAQGALDNLASLEAACAGCDIVFHVAAKADYWKDDDREALWRVNVEGTRNLLLAAQSSGVGRVIFTSSASTIGIRPGHEPASEADAFNLSPERFYYALQQVASRSCCGGIRGGRPGYRDPESGCRDWTRRPQRHLRQLHHRDGALAMADAPCHRAAWRSSMYAMWPGRICMPSNGDGPASAISSARET